MKKRIKNLFLGSILVSFACLSGCTNTLNGFGKDMQQNGQKIQNETTKPNNT